MQKQIAGISLLFTIMASTAAVAVGPERQLEFDSPNGAVIFDGATHKSAGLTCPDCHNKDLFPKMKQGTVKITMKDLYAGQYCGKCHDGKSSFMIKGNCIKCHYVPGA
jgi:c(7)-type cytochrome triheme protein